MPRHAADPFRDRPVPDWYRDAKLGIFVHWGIYSVPGWAPVGEGGLEVTGNLAASLPGNPVSAMEVVAALKASVPPEHLGSVLQFAQSPYAEWYWNSLTNSGTPTAEHHAEVWGGRDYRTFADDFVEATEPWNADDWGALFSAAGARYSVLTTKHHDGFCLWPTATPNPVEPGWRTERDLVGEFVTAMRSAGVAPALYYSGGLDWSLRGLGMSNLVELDAGIVQSDEHRAYMDAHVRELVERYRPDMLWGDIGYPRASDVDGLMAEYYDAVPHGVVNDRFMTELGGNDRHYDVFTTEYFLPAEIQTESWEVCEGIGPSFAYNRNEDPDNVKSSAELIRRLAEVVSKNGNLLLGVGPTGSGEIVELQRRRLLDVGAWLERNGEAIYETRPWTRCRSTTDTGLDVFFTTNAATLHALVMGATGETVTIRDVDLGPDLQVTRIDTGVPVTAHTVDGDLVLDGAANRDEAGFALRLDGMA